MSARVDLIRTAGNFVLDGGTFAVENNVWVIGDERECIVVDPSHEPDSIVETVGSRSLKAIVCTHGHNDHVNGAIPLADKMGAPVLLHPEDRELWDQENPERRPDWSLSEDEVLTVAGLDLHVLHTPGHTWGSVCLHVPERGWLFAGDTLFHGGPGATGRSYSDFDTIIDSISRKLLVLDGDTTVYPGHGPTTTIADEAPHLDEWIARGH